jgi:hypothetical protein
MPIFSGGPDVGVPAELDAEPDAEPDDGAVGPEFVGDAVAPEFFDDDEQAPNAVVATAMSETATKRRRFDPDLV